MPQPIPLTQHAPHVLAQPGVLGSIQVRHGRQVQLGAEFQLGQPLGGARRTRVVIRHQRAAHSPSQFRELPQTLLQRLPQPLHRRDKSPGVADQPRLRIAWIGVDLAPDMGQLRAADVAAELDLVAAEVHVIRQRIGHATGLRRRQVAAMLTPRLQHLGQVSPRLRLHRQHGGTIDMAAATLQNEFEAAPFVHALGLDLRQV